MPFYQSVFEGEDFVSASNRHLAPGFRLFHSEQLLLLALVKYVRRYCIGRGAAERREDLMSEVVAAGRVPDPETRRAIRHGIAPDQVLVDKFADIFLMGKAPGFGIEDVMTLVRQVVEREQR